MEESKIRIEICLMVFFIFIIISLFYVIVLFLQNYFVILRNSRPREGLSASVRKLLKWFFTERDFCGRYSVKNHFVLDFVIFI